MIHTEQIKESELHKEAYISVLKKYDAHRHVEGPLNELGTEYENASLKRNKTGLRSGALIGHYIFELSRLSKEEKL